jgi:hypothetical protein
VSSTINSPPSYSSGPVCGARHLADRVVDVTAERLAARIAVEERREHVQRQRRGDEERVALQRLDDHLAQLAADRVPLGQLPVVLGPRRLVAGGDLTVDPLGGLEQAARVRHLLSGKDVGDLNQHPTRSRAGC